MKWSQNLISVLSNFAAINNGLVIRPGKTIRTISRNKTILANAVVEESFQSELGIYDLKKLLALLSLNPRAAYAEVEDGSLVLAGPRGEGKITYSLVDTKLITAPPSKDIKFDKADAELTLTVEHIEWAMNVSSILGCPNVDITGVTGKEMTLNLGDVKGEVIDRASVNLDTVAESNFRAVFKIENWKLLPGDYRVEFSRLGFARFTHAVKKLQYWVAVEKDI